MIGRTGLYRFRRGLFGASVLQYQTAVPTRDGDECFLVWRDERFADAGFGEFRVENPAPAPCGSIPNRVKI